MKSIIQDRRKCFRTGRTDNLHEHHVFYGSNRKNSEKYGLKIWLTGTYHNQSGRGIHFDREFDLIVKKIVQKKAMEHYGWTVEDFIKIFGRNYLEG